MHASNPTYRHLRAGILASAFTGLATAAHGQTTTVDIVVHLPTAGMLNAITGLVCPGAPSSGATVPGSGIIGDGYEFGFGYSVGTAPIGSGVHTGIPTSGFTDKVVQLKLISVSNATKPHFILTQYKDFENARNILALSASLFYVNYQNYIAPLPENMSTVGTPGPLANYTCNLPVTIQVELPANTPSNPTNASFNLGTGQTPPNPSPIPSSKIVCPPPAKAGCHPTITIPLPQSWKSSISRNDALNYEQAYQNVFTEADEIVALSEREFQNANATSLCIPGTKNNGC